MKARNESDQPRLWYWSLPDNELTLEDCDAIFKEIVSRFQQTEKERKYILSPEFPTL